MLPFPKRMLLYVKKTQVIYMSISISISLYICVEIDIYTHTHTYVFFLEKKFKNTFSKYVPT